MDIFGFGTFFSGLADAIGRGIIDTRNFEEMKRQYDENMKFQKKQFDYTKELNDKNFKYQEWLNNKTMEREDNAVQRRMADLAKSGINPLMADGQSASSSGMSTAGGNSSSFHGQDAAQRNYSMDAGTMISAMLDMKRIKNESAMTSMERERLNSQLLNDYENRLYTIAKRITEEKEPRVREALIEQYNATAKLFNKKADALGHDIRIAETWKLPVGTDPTPNTPYGTAFRTVNQLLPDGNNNDNKGYNSDDKLNGSGAIYYYGDDYVYYPKSGGLMRFKSKKEVLDYLKKHNIKDYYFRHRYPTVSGVK